MSKSVLVIALLFISVQIYSQVGIGTTEPSSAAMLEVSSQTDGAGDYKGFLPPRVPDVTARNSINPAAEDIGLLVFVESSGCLQMWSGDDWINVRCTSPNAPPQLLAKQDFEINPSSPVLPIVSLVGGSYATGYGNFPNSPKYISPSRGYQVNDGTATLVLGPVDVSSYNTATVRLNLASFSGNETNGADIPDYVIVGVSIDGSSVSNEIKVTGNDNARYDFNATGVGRAIYYGDNNPLTIASPSGGDTTEGIAKIEITGIPNAASLYIHILMLNNHAQEFWVIDDVEVYGQ